MAMLSTDEFQHMEALLGALLRDPSCEPLEQEAILIIHQRLTAIHERQSGLRESHERLMALQSQTRQ